MCTIIRLLLLICGLIAVGKGLYLARDGFDLKRISCFWDEMPVIEELPNEIHDTLNQTFVYLGRGRQSFAFQSRDGRYVLKFPRVDAYRMPLCLRTLPFLKKKAQIFSANQKKRKEFEFHSFQIAYKELREETGLLYLHLHRTKNLPEIQIIDRTGRRYQIALDDTIFFLQKKLPIAFSLLKRCIVERNHEKAKEIVSAFLDLAQVRAKKEIFNRDSNFLSNFAYDGSRLFQIDVGSFHYKTEVPKERRFEISMLESMNQLCRWIEDEELREWTKKKTCEILKERCAS